MLKFACTQKIIAIRRGPNSLAPNNFGRFSLPGRDKELPVIGFFFF